MYTLQIRNKENVEILRICEGDGKDGDIELLEELAIKIRKAHSVVWDRQRRTLY